MNCVKIPLRWIGRSGRKYVPGDTETSEHYTIVDQAISDFLTTEFINL
jgi:hypothetical protein